MARLYPIQNISSQLTGQDADVWCDSVWYFHSLPAEMIAVKWDKKNLLKGKLMEKNGSNAKKSF